MKASLFLKIVTTINVLVAAGFSIVGMVDPNLILPAGINPEKALAIYTLYAGARTIPIAVAATLLVNKRRDAFITLAFIAGTIQFLDGFIGIYQHDLSKSAGPFFITAVQFIAIYIYRQKAN